MAVLALVAACGTGDTTIDRTFDPCAFDIDIDTAGVGDALAMWGLAAAAGAERIEIVFEDAAAAFHGHYDDEHGVVYINARISDPHARAVVIAHELGHAFGLPHLDDRTSVMNRGNFEIEPTADDRGLIVSCERPGS